MKGPLDTAHDQWRPTNDRATLNASGADDHPKKGLSSAENGHDTTGLREELRILNRLSSESRAAFTIRLGINQTVLRNVHRGALVDRGANGGIAGSDTTILH